MLALLFFSGTDMATVTATPEKLAEIKADDVVKTDGTSGPTSESEATVVPSTATPADASGDVPMTDENEKDKVLRAVRQSK